MLKNHIITAVRNLKRHKVFSAINILGLAGSMAVFIMITLYVRLIAGTDKFHENHARIFRIEREQIHNMTAPIGPYLKEQFPEVEEYIRASKIKFNSGLYTHNDKTIKLENVWLVDSSFFKVFSFPLLFGTPNRVLTKSEGIVLSESAAKRIFGDKNPIGLSLTTSSSLTLEVTGIMSDFPENSSIQADAIIPLEFYRIMRNDPKALDNFYQWNYSTLLLLKPGINIESFKNKMNNDLNMFIRKNIQLPNDEKEEFILTPYADIFFNTYKNDDDFLHGSRSNITIAIGVSLIILLLAIINFTNISTAQATYRTKEIGIRKTVGASKAKLIVQHLTESVIIAYISILIAVILVEQLLHLFSSMVNVTLNYCIFDEFNLLIILIVPLVMGILAGSYPAFYISLFSPKAILSGGTNNTQTGVGFRKFLTTFQFFASIVLIVFTLHVNKQVKYLNNRDLGISKENRIFVETSPGITKNREVFTNELQSNPIILSTSFHASPIGNFNEGWNMAYEGKDVNFRVQLADSSYFKTLDIKILMGRTFKNHEPSDSVYEVIINKHAVDLYGLDEPLGITLNFLQNTTLRVVGVMEDFHFESLHKPIGPLMIVNRVFTNLITINHIPGKTQETIQYIEKLWQRYSPNSPLTYSILSDDISKLYAEEARLKSLFQGFTAVAIFIACIGLFGLATFSIGKRVKEIGIRKVLGSSTKGVVVYLVWQFLRLILISMLISIPFSWWLITKWLQNFITPAGHSVWLYIGSGTLVMAIALATVIYHSIKAANTNPASVLKYE